MSSYTAGRVASLSNRFGYRLAMAKVILHRKIEEY
jgi:hypothetical protein